MSAEAEKNFLRFATIAAMSATSAVSGSPLTARQQTLRQAKVVFREEIGFAALR